ncbi:MAG TPA: HDOD domain-containing protein, partial [bacterium]|nr:HDOD domain-containing protein [bacterium]
MSSTVDPIKVRQMLSRIESVPTLPTVVSELFEQLRSPRTSADDINRIIVKDQSLTSKVLRVANSAFYGFPRKISSVTHAVVILGFETVRNLALTISVFSTFSSTEKGGFDRLAFWRHSLACAVISRSIAA